VGFNTHHEVVTTKKDGMKLWVVKEKLPQLENLTFGIFHVDPNDYDYLLEKGTNKKLVFFDQQIKTLDK